MTEKNYSWIDSLKGIAICGVVMVHSGVSDLPFPLGRLGAGGAYGVYIFFVLSALLAYTSIDKSIGNEQITLSKCIRWWKHKFIRLIPIFYLAIFITLIFRETDLSKDIVWNIITHLFLIHGFFPNYTNSIISVEWYLGVLVIFYLIVPFVHKYVTTLKKAWIMFGVSVACCEVINQIAFAILPQNLDDAYIYESYIGTFWIFEQLPILSLGIILYYLLKSIKWSKAKMIQMIFAIFSCCIFILGRAFGIFQHSLLINYTLCAVCTVCLALVLNNCRCVILENNLWAILGRYSYPIYLLHCFILKMYDRYNNLNYGNTFFNWFIKYLFVIIISLIASVLLTRFFDEPIQKWCKSKMDEKGKEKC